MFSQKKFANEIAHGMQKTLHASEKQKTISLAINHLQNASEILKTSDSYSFKYLNNIIKKLSKIDFFDPYTFNLTEEKMVENLLETGTVFDYSADDGNASDDQLLEDSYSEDFEEEP